MKAIIIVVAVIIALAAGFGILLYEVGKNMHMYRCGWRQPEDRGFM